MNKIRMILLVLLIIFANTSCMYGNIVDNKYTTTGFGNLTPVTSLKYYVGNPTYVWAGGYFNNLTTNNLNLYNTNTRISRDGLGNMIFTDAVSGIKTLAQLAVGSGGNVTGAGTLGRMTQWTSPSTIGSASNTDAQVSDSVGKAHMQGTDTSLGVQAAGLNMGGNAITNVGLVDGKDVSTLGIGNITGSGSTNRLPYFSGAQILGDSTIYYDVANARYGIGTTSPAMLLQLHDGSGENGVQLSYTAGLIYSNITSDHLGYLRLNPSGDRAIISGNLSMNSHYINNVVNPSAAQDAATKNYVDAVVGGSGNVTTGGGTATYIPKYTSATNIENADLIDTGHGITTTTNITATQFKSTVGGGTPPFIVGSGAWVGNLNVDQVDGLEGNDLLLVDGSHTLTGNMSVAAGITIDGVDISTLGVGSGNVTSVGMTAGFVPLSTSTTGLTNSIMTGNGTTLSILMVTGAELAPGINAANWTIGAGWSIVGTILRRGASAVTTAVPTVAIVPTVGSNYVVTFTVSNWTAGSVTMNFGGVESTPMQGNQDVYLYVSPYTTGNLIFTPTTTFSGDITVTSVKLYTGGELCVDGGVLFYDSRGHPNRLSHVTRHLNEMTTDTLLDKSRSTLTCAGGVLTYTLYAVYGQETWNFNGIVYPAPVASASVALTGGTDAAPKTNWVYFYLNGNTPTLAASTTAEPTTTHIMIAEFIVGAVSGSSYTIYGYNRARTEVDSFVKRVIGRFENSGSLYVEGALPTVNATAISVASGGKWYQGIFEMTANNTVTATDFYYMFSNGTYAHGTNVNSLIYYTDGTLIGNHDFANVVWGIVPTTTTASGTLPSTVKLFAVLQTKPTVPYSSLATVRQDLYDATNYYPPDAQLKEIFVPIARTIVSEDAPTNFQTFDTALYWKDLRGKVASGGGSASSAPDLSGYLLLDGTRPMTGNFSMGTTGNITLAAGMTVDGVDVSGLVKSGYGADAGASDTYACTVTGVTSYTTGLVIYFKANTANTGAATLNVNSLGAKALKINGGSADPSDNWIIANEIVHCIYGGTNFQVMNPDATP